MPYLEIFSAYYKQFANIDWYTVTLDIAKIVLVQKYYVILFAISPSYCGVEFFNVSDTRQKIEARFYYKK